MIAGRFRSVERTLALATIELTEVTAAERDPHDPVAIDVGAANAKARQRHGVDFTQQRLRIEAQERAGIAEGHAAPDRSIGRVRHLRLLAERCGLIHKSCSRLLRQAKCYVQGRLQV